MWKLFKYKLSTWWKKQCDMLDDVITYKFPNCKEESLEQENVCPTCHKNFGCQCGD